MAYQRYTQTQLKSLVRSGVAKDITDDDFHRTGMTVIGISIGTYGRNGMLLRDKSGKLYAITARSGAVFQYL